MCQMNSNKTLAISTRVFSFFELRFCVFLISTLLFHFSVPAEIYARCIPSAVICGNGVDEDCSGGNLPCQKCKDGSISETGCICGEDKKYSGYCCGGNWQITPCGGRIYYIDKNGDDSNDGSQSGPWKSFSPAIKMVKPGDTVLINPGKYLITKKISIRTSGEKGRPISFRGNGKNVILDFSKCKNGNAFEVSFAKFIFIENLTIRASQAKHSRGIRLTHSPNSVIRNNNVYAAGHANIFCSLSDRIVIEGNRAHDGQIGIYVADSTDYPIVKGNLSYNNKYIGLHMNGDLSSGDDGIISYAVVENNTFHENEAGMNIDGVTNSVFRNNLLYNNSKKGMAFFKGDGAVPSENNLIIHNTIVMPKGAYYAVGLNYGAYKNRFYNNLIIAEGNVPVFSTTGKASDLKISSDYNLFLKGSRIWEIEDSAYRFGKWEKMVRSSLNKVSQYMKGPENDRHSLEAEIEEVFVNHQRGNFNLKPDSPAIDRGTPKYSYGKDYRGNIRPNNRLPDLGAYEYSPRSKYSVQKPPANSPKATIEKEVSAKKLAQKAPSGAHGKMKNLKNRLGMEFAYIEPGSFKMGLDCTNKTADFFSICHEVNLEKDFYMQTTEITQGQWKKIMGDNPSFFQNCGNECPVEQVSWNAVQEFLKRLNKIENSGKYRLPTEAEWEYACKAGTETPFSFGRCLTAKEANYDGNFPSVDCPKEPYPETPLSITAFLPNPWGLVGMHGNVWEWCSDWLGDYSVEAVTNPVGPANGSLRVIRGGGWNSYAKACRSGNRSGVDPTKGFANLGFRVVREP